MLFVLLVSGASIILVIVLRNRDYVSVGDTQIQPITVNSNIVPTSPVYVMSDVPSFTSVNYPSIVSSSGSSSIPTVSSSGVYRSDD